VTAWLSVIGIGDDGIDGLSIRARRLLDEAELIVGGSRHQAMVTGVGAERLTWSNGVACVIDQVRSWRGRRVVVLASGDPMWFGAGANLARTFPAEEMQVLPQPGAFSLAAAKMGWPLADVETLTVHARPVATISRHIQPGQRLLLLSRDGDTPAEVAALLRDRGFAPSLMTVWEHLGGPAERRIDGTAAAWPHLPCADLNTIAIACRSGDRPRLLSTAPGLPDDAFEHDGQLTKREVRAATIAALAPLPGQVLWDIGAGAGSVAIEWLRVLPWRRRSGDEREPIAIAVERDANRCTIIARNALALGVPQLRIVRGCAPAVLAELSPPPDTVFIGGGATTPGLLEACWAALVPGGHLVANAVTLEAVARLIDFRQVCGGRVTRLAVARTEPVGVLTTFRPLLEITQLAAVKAG
jgi:precorrin-6Y C5,15-methyltransferase (decarboxylating)